MLVDRLTFYEAVGFSGSFNAFIIFFLGVTAAFVGYSREYECIDENQCKELNVFSFTFYAIAMIVFDFVILWVIRWR
jgi:hypothetical protein